MLDCAPGVAEYNFGSVRAYCLTFAPLAMQLILHVRMALQVQWLSVFVFLVKISDFVMLSTLSCNVLKNSNASLSD